MRPPSSNPNFNPNPNPDPDQVHGRRVVEMTEAQRIALADFLQAANPNLSPKPSPNPNPNPNPNQETLVAVASLGAIHSSMGEYRLARPLLQQALVVVVLFTKSLTRNIWPTG